MRILVAIANYGWKNVGYARRVIDEYRALPFDTRIFVLSESEKDYGEDITVLVGLPSTDPWSLPFAHKSLFAKHWDEYDLFIYSEDDVLIRRENILAFLEATECLDKTLLPGFLRYEVDNLGGKSYPDVHGPFRWIPETLGCSGVYRWAKFSNDHSACYILTRAQLRAAIDSGGFLVPPHEGRYDLICTAGNDPYTQCGFSRVICFSHLRDFEVHHLSNAYVNRVGLEESGLWQQLEALEEIEEKHRAGKQLFPTEKPLDTMAWDRDYYEPCRFDLLERIPSGAHSVLSIGSGWGATERQLTEQGKQVTVIPLDRVIARLVQRSGMDILAPDFDEAFESLGNRKFHAIILPEILQHLSDPMAILCKVRRFLDSGGILVGSVPNISLGRRVAGRALGKEYLAQLKGSFAESGVQLTDSKSLRRWFAGSRLNILEMHYSSRCASGFGGVLAGCLPDSLSAARILFVAEPMTS